MSSNPLKDIYYIRSSQDCVDIVDKYEISRSHVGNEKEFEGVIKLKECVINELDSWRNDIYYKERIKVESIAFLQNLMCHQYIPNNSWNKYYEDILKCFHKHNELTFKVAMCRRKVYLKKKSCLRITLCDGTIVPYMSYSQLGEDFGRYLSDVIIRQCRALNNGKNIDFEWILTLIL